MAIPHGRFVWYELLTTDRSAARDFYTKVIGWTASDEPMPGQEGTTYGVFKMGDQMVAGLFDLPQQARDMGAPPSWLGYISADDVDASAVKATSLGGRVVMGPMDIPTVGRFATVADPFGAVFSLFKPATDEDVLPDQMAQGRVGWHELYAGDLNAAWDFYSQLFGWQKGEAMDMGDMGVYQIFGFGELMLGGMMTRPPTLPVSYWAYYFSVGNIDEAVSRVKEGGGQVLIGPEQVPGGGWIVQGGDPQGAAFALFGTR